MNSSGDSGSPQTGSALPHAEGKNLGDQRPWFLFQHLLSIVYHHQAADGKTFRLCPWRPLRLPEPALPHRGDVSVDALRVATISDVRAPAGKAAHGLLLDVDYAAWHCNLTYYDAPELVFDVETGRAAAALLLLIEGRGFSTAAIGFTVLLW